ncbi:hypothetical protein AGMMS4957_01090 [Bacteroidia bacterium]|nr:hypothetical protein AGMMS4957_01090 [Bacteroidia bacterium]
MKVTLHIDTAGTLPALIGDSEKYQITDLTLTGNLNGTDIRYIREMAKKLATLNLADAKIVSGGVSYAECEYDHSQKFFTDNDTISDGMFDECVELRSITIPTVLLPLASVLLGAAQN